MVCPWRKQIVKEIDDDGTITISINYLDCYKHKCPFWNGYTSRCLKQPRE